MSVLEHKSFKDKGIGEVHFKSTLDEETCQKLARVEILQSDSLLNLSYSKMYAQLLQV